MKRVKFRRKAKSKQVNNATTILYARRFQSSREEFANFFFGNPFLNIVGNVESVESATEIIKSKRPDVIITGSIFDDGRIEDILKAVKAEKNYRPYIILITSLPGYLVDSLVDNDVDLIFYEYAGHSWRHVGVHLMELRGMGKLAE